MRAQLPRLNEVRKCRSESGEPCKAWIGTPDDFLKGGGTFGVFMPNCANLNAC